MADIQELLDDNVQIANPGVDQELTGVEEDILLNMKIWFKT